MHQVCLFSWNLAFFLSLIMDLKCVVVIFCIPLQGETTLSEKQLCRKCISICRECNTHFCIAMHSFQSTPALYFLRDDSETNETTNWPK